MEKKIELITDKMVDIMFGEISDKATKKAVQIIGTIVLLILLVTIVTI